MRSGALKRTTLCPAFLIGSGPCEFLVSFLATLIVVEEA